MNTLTKKLNYKDFKKYIEKNFPNEEDETACWNGARLLREITGFSNNTDEPDSYPVDLDKPNDMLDWNGIYHLHIDTNLEEHYFTLVIEDDKLLVISTYGGYPKFIIKIFSKNIWIKLFENLKDLNTYKFLFDLPLDAFCKYKKDNKIIVNEIQYIH